MNYWNNIINPPDKGGEYQVVWNLGDNEYPVVTTMDYDAISNTWEDPRGVKKSIGHELLYWKPLDNPPENIPEILWKQDVDDKVVYGHCVHGENMTTSYKCNPF